MNSKLLPSLLLSLFISVKLLAQVYSTPPPIPVRTMAEWEELQALVITWNISSAGDSWRNILTEITRAARKECKVIINCNTQSIATAAKNYLSAKLVDTSSNVEFLVVPNNSIWIRDYGPNCVYANDVDSLHIVDWIYNRDRPEDNNIPVKLGQYLHLPVFSTNQAPYDLVNTGGNFMSDGMGTGFASTLIFTNNDQLQNGECNTPNDVYGSSSHTEASIDNIMQEFMGIDRYIKFDPLPYDCIHHIDMHMKLIDEQTLLVGQYPPDIADGPQIEANIQYILNNFKTSFGTPFKIVRIPMPPDGGNYPDNNGDYRTYANAVFVNKTILVPFYEAQFDTTAKRIWEQAMPGYTVVGINCNSIISYSGAIHCITKEIGVADPLLIVHQALPCQDNSLQPNYPVFASIQHRTGISTAKVYYTTDLNAPWQSVDMQPYTVDTTNVWTANIPPQALGSTVHYYIEASANNGKTLTRPITAPEGQWSFCVTQSSDATELPTIELADVYPNPAAAVCVVPVQVDKKTKAQILLVNMLGQSVETIFNGELPSGKSNYFFDAARFVPGMYFIELQANGVSISQKVVIH
jgi:agmatine deiminase